MLRLSREIEFKGVSIDHSLIALGLAIWSAILKLEELIMGTVKQAIVNKGTIVDLHPEMGAGMQWLVFTIQDSLTGDIKLVGAPADFAVQGLDREFGGVITGDHRATVKHCIGKVIYWGSDPSYTFITGFSSEQSASPALLEQWNKQNNGALSTPDD